jgi:acetoin utilization protein AcuB
MRVADRMRREPPVLDVHASLGDAARLMARTGLGAIPVLRHRTLVGVVDATDVARAHPSAATTLTVGEIHARLDQVPVGRVLGPIVTAVGVRTSLADAMGLMRARRLATLPVVRGDELVGLLVEEDLLDLLATLLDDDAPGEEPDGPAGPPG